MSSIGSRALRAVGPLVLVALAACLFCAPASAKHLSAKQRARIARELRREVKRHPKAIRTRRFLKRASMVNFRLPVTIFLKTGDDPRTPNLDESGTRNPNTATVDLGTSLGRREVELGGSLRANIVFADSYDGGALGNVKIELLPDDSHVLRTTSIPILWSDRVWADKSTRWDANAVNDLILSGQQATVPGCSDFDSSSPDVTRNLAGNLIFARGYEPVIGGPGLPGYPLNIASDANDPAKAEFDPNNPNVPEGFLENQSGIDTPSQLRAAKNPGDPMSLGGNPQPFPFNSDSTPGGFNQPPSVSDTVFRTSPLALQIAPEGTQVNHRGITAEGGDPDGVSGAQNEVIGKSGGQANLFGQIPGKSYAIDVTASFQGRINSILRIMDQDLPHRNLIEGEHWPAGVFGCRQVYTGYVDNQIPGVHLRGNLRISPAVTADGHVRIARASVTSLRPTQFAVAACTVPLASFQKPNDNPGENRPDMPAGTYTEYDDHLPTPFSGNVLAPLDPVLYPLYTGQFVGDSELPVDVYQARATPPGRKCNSHPDKIVEESSIPPFTVDEFPDTAFADEAFVNGSGSEVTVAADLNVQRVELDIVLGDVAAPPAPPPNVAVPDPLGDLLGGIIGTVPPVAVPGVTVPETTVPSATTPSATVPSTTTTVPVVTTTVTTPEVTVPEVTTPETTLPGVTTTTETLTVPTLTTPETTIPTVSTTLPTDTTTLTTPTVTLPGGIGLLTAEPEDVYVPPARPPHALPEAVTPSLLAPVGDPFSADL